MYLEMISRSPVSYTHLDVYKRQLFSCFSGDQVNHSCKACRESLLFISEIHHKVKMCIRDRYTAMADLAATEHDEKLFAACERLWNNMTEKKMYITGGIGSTVEGAVSYTHLDVYKRQGLDRWI